jgi:hypothetical protein
MVNRKQMLGLPVKIQEDGTIHLPKDMLEFAGIIGTVEVFADKSGIYLRTADVFCDFCGMNGNITEKVGDKKICQNCLEQMAGIIKAKQR